ncbi:LPS export ABC transporter ATP-binding protein [Flavisolibacter ginsenosidimutans]|uniref:LPS export ABC transporter ATP-binding protein n=1 Tax=Flavisolibacter ginsenosidimutans TaxID=661481 RepID=UPI001D15A600|nr:LPS export ABC transporter ATP-binding protein [Flavisolibacter ginsenosidimutans]
MSIRIHTHDLVKRYGKRTVVNHASVEVRQGEIVGLLGPNGAGKTTTFYMVVGLIKPDEGAVYLDDEDITKLAMYKRAQLGIGYLPQEASVFRKLSVEDNISAVLEMTKLSRKQQKEKLESLLDEFRLHHVRKSPGDVLSGGERRRTEIARALAVDPKFILLDEPFAGIDPIAVEDIQAIVAKLKYKNIGILITDHNVTETLSICDRAYLLIEGKIFQHGTAEELAINEDVKKLYLGRNFELKRKDYLYEGLRETKAASLESIVRNLDDLYARESNTSLRLEAAESVAATAASLSETNDEAINSRMQLDKQFSETVNAIEIFLSEKGDNELKTEVANIFEAGYERRKTVDALLNTFRRYQLQNETV